MSHDEIIKLVTAAVSKISRSDVDFILIVANKKIGAGDPIVISNLPRDDSMPLLAKVAMRQLKAGIATGHHPPHNN